MTDWILPFLCGLGASILSAWGVGGGTLLLLVMTLFLDIDQRTAQGINLLFFLPAAGTPVNSSQDLLRVRRGLYVGDQVTMEIWRDGQRLEVTLELNDAAS